MRERMKERVRPEDIKHWVLTIITDGVEKIKDINFTTSEKAHYYLVDYIVKILNGIINEFKLYDEYERKRYNLNEELTDLFDYDIVNSKLSLKNKNIDLPSLQKQAKKLVKLTTDLHAKLNLDKPTQMFAIWAFCG
jgi:cell shape-determining protein MreC